MTLFDNADKELLEAAGAFVFRASLAPRDWRYFPLSRALDEDCREFRATQRWWQSYQPAMSIRDFCNERFDRSDSSPWEFSVVETVWATADEHKVELFEDDDSRVALLEIRIDVRFAYADFLSQIVDLANQSKCVLYLIDEDDFIDPSSVGLFEAVSRSQASCLVNADGLVADTH